MCDKKEIRILFQGDSITDAGRARDNELPPVANDRLGNGYPAFAATRLLCDCPELNLQFFNRGISGNRISDLYARWKIDAVNLKPDVLSILIGVNDTWHDRHELYPNGVEPARAEMMYRNLLTWTKEALPETDLILMEPFVFTVGAVTEDWLPEINQRREYTKRLAEEFGATFIPCQSILDAAVKNAPMEYWLRDGVHPALPGAQLLADAWIQAALPLIRKHA